MRGRRISRMTSASFGLISQWTAWKAQVGKQQLRPERWGSWNSIPSSVTRLFCVQTEQVLWENRDRYESTVFVSTAIRNDPLAEKFCGQNFVVLCSVNFVDARNLYLELALVKPVP
jgi:hypothetical protein